MIWPLTIFFGHIHVDTGFIQPFEKNHGVGKIKKIAQCIGFAWVGIPGVDLLQSQTKFDESYSKQLICQISLKTYAMCIVTNKFYALYSVLNWLKSNILISKLYLNKFSRVVCNYSETFCWRQEKQKRSVCFMVNNLKAVKGLN